MTITSLTTVIQIQRHGARFPTSGASARIQAALQRFQSASEFLDPKLKFLKNYTYSLSQDDLVPFGAQQFVKPILFCENAKLTCISRAKDSGMEAYYRYSFLVSQDNLPFVRASLSSRVVDTANNWTTGSFSLVHLSLFAPLILPRVARIFFRQQ